MAVATIALRRRPREKTSRSTYRSIRFFCTICGGVQRVWQSWYDWVKPIKIEAPARASPAASMESAMFYSGGVDSFFSLLGAYPEIDRNPRCPAD